MDMPSTVFLSPMITGSRELMILGDDRKAKLKEPVFMDHSVEEVSH